MCAGQPGGAVWHACACISESCLLAGGLIKLSSSANALHEHARRYCEIHVQLPGLLGNLNPNLQKGRKFWPP